MPFIPRINPQEQRAVPAPAIGTVPVPQVNNRGLMQAAGALGQAAQQTMVPTEPFLAPGKGLEAVGQGITSIAGMVAKFAEAKAEVRNDKAVIDADNALSMSYAKFQKDMQSLPPERWSEEWDTRASQDVQTLMENDKLSTSARRRVELLSQKWRGNTAVQVATLSIQAEGRRAEDGALEVPYRHMAGKDFKAARASVDELEKSGKFYMPPLRLRKVREDIDAAEEEEKLNVTHDTIHRDPRAWMAENAVRPKDMSAAKYDKLMDRAKRADRENVVGDADALENAISAREITVPAEVDEWQKDNPRLTPRIRELAKQHVHRMTNAMEREVSRANAPENSSRLLSELADLDPETATDEQMAGLRHRIAELPQGYRELPHARFIRKWRAHEEEETAPKSMLEFGDNIIHEYYKSGGMGAYDHGTGKDAAGKPVTPGSPQEVHQRSLPDHVRALGVKSKTGGEYNRWLQRNPKATEDDVLKKISELVPEAARAGLFDLFGPSPPPASTGLMLPAKAAAASAAAQAEVDAGNEATRKDKTFKKMVKEGTATADPDAPEDPDPGELPTEPGPMDNMLLPYIQQ